MTDHHEETAKTVMEAFKASLDENVCAQISDAQFDTLVQAIREALSSEKAAIADKLEGVVNKLRSEVDKIELEL